MSTPICSILIPTDFSILSENALKIGIAIARRQKSEITLLHVVDQFSYIQPAEVFFPEFKVTEDIISRLEVDFKELTKKITDDTDVKIGWKIKAGIPSFEICKLAYEDKIDMIVMGTHGTSGLREFFIGSVAFSVLKNAAVPVLTIPGDWGRTEFKRIVFPIRLLPGAVEKYNFARPIVEKNNAELLVLGLTDTDNPDNVKDVLELINKLKKQLVNDNIKSQTVVCPYLDFASETIKLARDFDADLIILSANLDYDFKALFIGPFAQQVINHSKLPVLSIKPSHVLVESESMEKRAGSWGRSINFNDISA